MSAELAADTIALLPDEVVAFSPGAIRGGARRVGIYCRISSDPKGRELGVQRQEKTGRLICQMREWAVVDVYIDNDISASTKSKKKRPEFERMISDLRTGRINAVVAYNLARLTRRMIEGVAVFGLFSELGVAYTDSEASDTTTSSGRMIINIKLSVAQQQAEQTAELVLLAKAQRRDAGLMDPPTQRCFGYEAGSYEVPQIHEAPFLVKVFRKILIGGKTRDVAEMALAAGLTGTAGSERWSAKQIHIMLRRPMYAGLMLDSEGRLITAQNVVGIIEPDVWHAVQTIMDENGSGPRADRCEYFLSGRMFCTCGTRLTAQAERLGKNGRVKQAEWVCGKNRGGGGSTACGAVTRSMKLVDLILDAHMRQAIESTAALTVESVPAVDHSAEIERIEAQIAAIQADVIAGKEDRDDARVYLRGYREQVNALRLESNTATRTTARARVVAEVDQLAAWEDRSPEGMPARRAILAQHVSGIEIGPVPKGAGRKQGSYDSVRILPA